MKSIPTTNEDVVAVGGDAWNAVAEAINYLLNLKVAAPLEMPDSPGGPLIALREGLRPIVRMKVTNATAGTDVVLAKRYDGTTTSGDDIAIRSTASHALNDELYSYEPAGGTDKTYSSNPVVWREVGGGGGSVAVKNNGVTELASAAFINIPSLRNMDQIMEFDTNVVDPSGADLMFKTVSANGKVLQWRTSGFVWDFPVAHI